MGITSSELSSVKLIGGYHPDPALCKWECGSMFAHEGIKLYELVRKHKPKRIVEIGSWRGCSTTYLAMAVKHNGFGEIISIDIRKDAGRDMPEELRKYVTFKQGDALKCRVPKNIDFLFEDGSHNTGFTSSVLKRFKAKVVVCHDYLHPSHCLETVHDEMNEVLGVTEAHNKPPHSCGLGIWVEGEPLIEVERNPDKEW